MRTRKRVVLQCCGYKRCPVVEFLGAGRIAIVDQDDGRDQRIELAAEQVDILRELLGSSPTVPRSGRQ